MLKSLVGLVLLIAAATCQNNIDTRAPILRSVIGLRPFDYFSYSMVLHQRQANPSNRANSLATTSIIVSAPMQNLGGAVNTGAVWDCPVSQGPCTALNGDGTGADRRLHDTDVNAANENKTNQFLGGSMASNGDFFIVCAHRYKVLIGGFYYPRGRCYYSGRSLSGFTEHTPCDRFGGTGNGGTGVCNAGTSAVVTTDSGSGVFGVGAPGSYFWRGSTTRLQVQGNVFGNTPRGDDDALFGLLGYSMVAGRFADINRLDYAVGNPRYSLNTYLGRVTIVMNSASLAITNQPLNGQQMGEYYGFSLLAANMAGDGHDELIVGAPMFRSSNQAETGRIFVYSNTNGALSLVRTIVGTDGLSRFGYAMANLGDINGDGFDDIAVSAPFGSGSGSVFIYYSSATNTISPLPAQTITGTMVNLNLMNPTAVTGFGTSLASGVDVDGNTYNDLAVGSFKSQQVYLLRTRPLASVAVTMTPSKTVVNVQTEVDCPLPSGIMYACFVVTTCFTYSGPGVSSTLELDVTLFAERERLGNNLEQRIFFNNGITGQFPSMATNRVPAAIGVQSCFETTAYIQNGISDIFNGFVVEAVIVPPNLDPAATDGNPANPLNFGGFPVVSITGATSVQVETFKDCDGNTCTPNLSVSATELSFTGPSSNPNPTEFTVGAVSQINTQLTIRNTADDAFSAVLVLRYRTAQLQLQRVYNNTVIGQLTLSCTPSTDDEFTLQSCNIGNPLNSDAVLTVNALFSPRPELIGNEGTVTVLYTVDSLNDELAGNEADNSFSQGIPINARADISLDIPGVVFPESVSYSDVAPEGAVANVTQLGPSVRTTFVVRNRGPSSVPTVELTVMWPVRGSDSELHTFLYPASVSATSSATVVCDMTFVNPSMYALPVDGEDTAGEGGQGVAPGGRKRRRRRSVPEVGRKVKRQTVIDNSPDNTMATTQERAFSCADNVPTLTCQPITCSILGLQGGSSAQVEILAYADERYFASTIDRFTFTPTASVRIVNADYIVSASSPDSLANIRVIPAGTMNPVVEPPPFPWYAVVFPIIAVIIIIAAIAVGLYFCGFFRRDKHEEIKQKREELANLTENGVAPGEPEDGTKL
ncbi:integrin alpha-PS1-like [Halichondria panicea]|uniref:integrin alpha-PS1-like n=1 Tax=Halichondria panicea TaxID=6063 RepID=UPI00312B4F5C